MTDQLQIEGLERQKIIGNPHQRADFAHIEQFAEALGWLVTSYAIKYNTMPQVRQVSGVSDDGKPFSEISLRSE